MCADVRPQRLWMKKEDTIHPTESIKGLMFSFMIGAKEDRDTETPDITGYFLQTDETIGITHLKFDGMIEELWSCIDPYLYIK